MNEWTPKAVTQALLRLGAFAAVIYLLVTGIGTADLIAIGGMLALVGDRLMGEPTPAS